MKNLPKKARYLLAIVIPKQKSKEGKRREQRSLKEDGR